MKNKRSIFFTKGGRIVLGSWAASLVFHGVAFVFIQHRFFWFDSSPNAPLSENWVSLIDKKEKDLVLKTAFDSLSSSKETKGTSLEPQSETAPPLRFAPSSSVFQKREEEKSPASLFSLPVPFHESLARSAVPVLFSFPDRSLNLLEHLPKDLILPKPHSNPSSSPLAVPASSSLAPVFASKTRSVQEASLEPICYPKELGTLLTDPPQPPQAPPLIPFPNLPKLPTLAELETASYSSYFEADLVFLPKEEGEGYIFALTLIPHPDFYLPKLKQQITFLIDRSNSIQQGRLSATKGALHKALEELAPEDTFNLIAFDSKMEKMSPHPLPSHQKSFAIAEQFLENIQLGSFFSNSDLYKPLFLTVPDRVEQDEIHTAILLTDGESLAKKGGVRSLLNTWTNYNSGKVSLFTVGMNDSQMGALEAAASFNRGKAIRAPSHRGLKRKLAKLVRNLQNPIAKNIACHAIGRSSETAIELFPSSAQMPHLYLDQPYVILGETKTLDDFIFFMQGRLKKGWLNVKKTISFLQARKGNRSLREEWALQKAYRLYEEYMKDENPKHLIEARSLLEPYGLQTVLR